MNLPACVFAADSSGLAPAVHVAAASFRVPRCFDPAFIPMMLELCEREGVGLVVPTIDPELPFYAAAREQFAAVGTTVAVSSPRTIEVSADKRFTYAFLTEHGLPTVEQAEVDEVRKNAKGWRFPLIVKPARGSASIGVRTVHNPVQFDAAVADEDVVVQTAAPGHEYTIDVFVDGGRVCRDAVPRKRLEVRAGEVSKAVTVRSEALMALADNVCKALVDPYGVLNIQVFWDEATERARIIEINPRFGGGFPLAHQAGAPFVQWLVEMAFGLPASRPEKLWQDGLLMLRYDDAVFLDADDLMLRFDADDLC